MKNLLEIIEDQWYLDSKQENSIYFYHHESIIRKILNGRKFYIIGRKGTGKTAISKYIIENSDYNIFTEKLTFKNFPFNDLYDLYDKGFKSPNQYITLWKFVIYITICRMMIDSENTPQLIKIELKKVFNDSFSDVLAKRIRKWTSGGFNISVLMARIGMNIGSSIESIDISWIEKVNILERFILEYCSKDDKYILSFDELDEDYKDMIDKDKKESYSHLLTGLFKAVQDIRYIMSHLNIFPVIFIRDDIYAIINDPDKNKWSDFSYHLEWNEDSIKDLLAFRLTKVINIDSKCAKKFNDVWNYFFLSKEVPYGDKGKKRAGTFNYITKNTLLRPRDYIKYLQICAEKSIKLGRNKISPDVIKKANKDFSNHLKMEMIDEIHSIIPDIDKILDIFSQLRKQTFSISEFKNAFDEYLENNPMNKYDFQYILKTLFEFSVIGNVPRQKSFQVFKYRNKEANLNLNENITIHRVLFRALQIV